MYAAVKHKVKNARCAGLFLATGRNACRCGAKMRRNNAKMVYNSP